MSQPRADHILLDRGGPLAGGFVADRKRSLPLDQVRAPCMLGLAPSLFRRRSVLLAVPDPLKSAVALVQLAGSASRIVLWPRDEPSAAIGEVIKTADIDVVVTDWELPDQPGGQQADQALSRAGHSVQADPVATEWVLLTSGTTGRPKLVVHTLQSLSGHLACGPNPERGTVWCTFYDLSRYGGLQILLRALLGGGSLLLPQSLGEKLDDYLVWAAASGTTHFLGTPSHWRRVLMSPAAHALTPRYIRLSGEIVDQPILDRLAQAYPAARLVHAFASTEAGLAFEVEDGLAGVPLAMLDKPWRAGITIRLVDGALQVRSAGAARGILQAGKVVPVVGPDGFVDTHDVLVSREGRLQFDGRGDDVVNIGGRKVHPARVEAVINAHPAVRMSRVQGRTNPIMGALVSAEVVCASWPAAGAALLSGDMPGLARDIIAFCRTRLAAHEVPATIRIVPSLALASSGKLARPHA